MHRAVLDRFVEKLAQKARSIEGRIGDPLNTASAMGPVISQRQLDVVTDLVNSARKQGATVICGGVRLAQVSQLDGFDLSRGFFYAPTIVTSSNSVSIRLTRLWREEAFGPVLVIDAFETEAEALELANDSEYGLGSGIWTRDGAKALRLAEGLDHGLVWINTHHRYHSDRAEEMTSADFAQEMTRARPGEGSKLRA